MPLVTAKRVTFEKKEQPQLLQFIIIIILIFQVYSVIDFIVIRRYMRMALLPQLLLAILLLTNVNARPSDQLESEKITGESGIKLPEDEDPELYFIIASVPDDDFTKIAKRSAEEVDDLETAAGTNVLRPLFVYRQQLAYRERVKKGARRAGIRPRF